MKPHSVLLSLAIGVSFANGCQRDFRVISPRDSLDKRSAKDRAPFPPALDDNESILVNSFDSVSIDQWSYYYTHGAHLAGTNRSMAQWTADRWAENGFTSSVVPYWIYLNYPVSHSLFLQFSNGAQLATTLQEDSVEEDETTTYPNRIPTFNGYSFSGNASAEYVYIGRGEQADFARLKELGVPLEGKIALAKYGGPFRGLKVKNAQENGMIGTILFTDPDADGNMTVANGYVAYPNGPARNPTSVQMGSVSFLSIYPGDPTTPGYASKEDSPRADKSAVVPHIPSLPISYRDAQPFLAALDGHGTSGEDVNRTGWVGALNATYSTGPSPDARISMSNIMRDAITPVWDAIGIINGTLQNEVIVVGNHRDAWSIGGAADPNSGSSVMIELSKAFGALLATGWKPRRTIILGSWDAEEYGTIGSTEWVEDYAPWLKTAAVTYLNIDIATSGPIPGMDASPELIEVAKELTKKVIWPNVGSADVYPNQTFYDVWLNKTGANPGVLGAGSDYTAFVHSGISSLDISAGGGPEDPIYHYHSHFDTYHWMTNFGDPGFVVHKAMGQYLSLLLYHLANDEVVPFNVNDYASALSSYFESLQETVAGAGANVSLNLSELASAIDTFKTAASDVTAFKEQAVAAEDRDKITTVNHSFRDFQRGFISQGGLPGREFFKHVVNAPGIDSGYGPVTFPGITEAVQAGNLTLAAEWVKKTSAGVRAAAEILSPYDY
ncbi:Zn-dependent exopeptidase [Aulographum hederae CBS 113979]|uniref:Zn-dependent exopeptidase n=1 Tax=Aulographum hederae CBS 113979 TaxID=1176131 RepID=A0A6G1H5P5_9PEZI|nr:Zn-dependent exopeptidase [Aulographum hederae CBS 113979]